MEFVPLHSQYLDSIIELSDREIGTSYYCISDLKEQLYRSSYKDEQLSVLVFERGELIGFRLTAAPGKWDHGRGKGLSPHLWPYPLAKAAYFQSCFVSGNYTGRGIGKQLSLVCIEKLRALDIPMVVAHSWKESPHNSSFRYLSALGFKAVAEYPDYWREVDYECALDGKPCRCTAIEMVLDLNIYQSC